MEGGGSAPARAACDNKGFARRPQEFLGWEEWGWEWEWGGVGVEVVVGVGVDDVGVRSGNGSAAARPE